MVSLMYALMRGYCFQYSSIICAASLRGMPKFSANPKADCPYIIPKFTAFAFLRCSLVTSSNGIPYTFAAVAA